MSKPEPPRMNDGELSPSDLDNVSGGASTGPDVCVLPTPGPTPTPYPNVGDVLKGVSNVLKKSGFE
jgi:hypothetical protein